MQEKKIKYIKELLIIAYRQKRVQIESLAIHRKSNWKKHNNIKQKKSEIQIY